jgi:uncharacterized Rmd1/YagE family protein
MMGAVMSSQPDERSSVVDRRLVQLGAVFRCRAHYLGERLDVRGLEPRMSNQLPVMVEVGSSGCAALFRYGAVVLFGVAPVEEAGFLEALASRVQESFARPESEAVEIRVSAEATETVEPDFLVLREVSVERLQVVAEILAKSVVLARHEQQVTEVFAKVEPLAARLHQPRLGFHVGELLRHIGGTLLMEHQMVGRAEMLEKPELLWDRPDLERLYARLEDEYEVRERHLVLERKLTLISQTARTMLEVVQAKRSLRVEWYIVALIVVEILLSLYDMFG